jgi:hypothetical protein
MSTLTINEQTIVAELHQVPEARWGEVLTFIRSLHRLPQEFTPETAIRSGADLIGSELIGMWADRNDITDNHEFARQLRLKAEHRRGNTDASGH